MKTKTAIVALAVTTTAGALAVFGRWYYREITFRN